MINASFLASKKFRPKREYRRLTTDVESKFALEINGLRRISRDKSRICMLKTTSGSPVGPVMSTTRDNCIGRITRCLITGFVGVPPTDYYRERESSTSTRTPRSEKPTLIVSAVARISQKPRRPVRKHEAGFRVIRTAA